MAAKSFYEAALAHIDAQIADLNRARDVIVMCANTNADVAQSIVGKPTRKPRKKRAGLPTDSDGV
jgi:hypothetical protein